jgi:predicted membrane protein
MSQCKTHKRYGLGIVFIIAGAIFLLGNLGMIPANIYDTLTSWPMIFVAIGVISLFKRDVTATIIMFALAAYFMLPNLIPGVSMHEIWKFWPILLIVIGLSFIFRRKKNSPFVQEMTIDNDMQMDEVAIFGGRVIQIDNQNFKGGRITSIFGGSEIHFTKARMAEGGAVIEIECIFGGTKLIIPRDWNVKVEVTSIFGGFTDKRLYTSPEVTSNKTLFIKGTTIFGGGELLSI